MRTCLPVSFLLLLLAAGPGQAQAQRPVIQHIHAVADPRQDSVFRLGNTVTLEVSGLGNWIRQREKVLLTRMEAPQAQRQARDLVLYINDVPLLNMPPLAVYTEDVVPPTPAVPAVGAARPAALVAPAAAGAAAPAAGAVAALEAQLDTAIRSVTAGVPDSTLRFPLDALPGGGHDKVVFQLRRTPDNIRYWNVLYGSPWSYAYPGKIGLGYADQLFTDLYPLQQDRTIRLELIQPHAFWLAGLAVLLLGGTMLWLGLRSWLLRDTTGGADGDPDASSRTVDEADPPFSLSRVQLAWWIFIILGSHIVIYCVTGVMPDISTTSLALLGISGGTTVLSGLTTSGQGASAAASPAAGPPEQSRGFWTDLLSDEYGVCIHRLQKLITSLVMGCFFIRTVYDTVATPVWTANQTLLLAISSATYLGLKWQETSSAAAPAATGGAPGLGLGSLGAALGLPDPGAPGLGGGPADPAPGLPGGDPASPLGGLPSMLGAGSLADPVTGAVIRRQEDDMGPPAPGADPDYAPAGQDAAEVPG